MKYTFGKFKIQLAAKPNLSLQKNKKFKQTSNHKQQLNKRYAITAQLTHRKKNINQEDLNCKGQKKLNQPGNQSQNCINRSQSLKNQLKDWLDLLSLNQAHKQKQPLQIKYQQKCFDLHDNKRSKIFSQKKVQISVQNKGKLSFFDKNQKKVAQVKQNSVQEMMNNIIRKFKIDSRVKSYAQKLKDFKRSMNRKDHESFITIKNEHPHFRNLGVQKVLESNVSHVTRSAQLRRNCSQDNQKQNQSKGQKTRLFQEKQTQSCLMNWRQVPDVTGVRVNKILNKGFQSMNPVVCTSLALNSPHRELKNNLLAFQHIKLSPYRNIISTVSANSKRKKININKALTLNRFMRFTKNNSDEQYNKKLKSYLDFLFKINYSNNIYVSLQLVSLDDTINVNISHKYKVYVGQGNNALLIKSLLKRRQWIHVVDNIDQDGIQFFWTQNRANQIHQKQHNCMGCRQNTPRLQNKLPRKGSCLKAFAEIKELNTKVLPLKKSEDVQNYIHPDGYEIPFDKQYQVKAVTNHIPQNYVIGSKKNLFKSMFAYYTNIAKKDPFIVIPKTYHIKSYEDPEFKRFVKQNMNQPKKLWIVKPGQNTNRGNGIKLCPFSKIQALIKQKVKHQNGHLMTYIVQSYINKPFLYNGRKFDIRHYILITSVNGMIKVYWYRDGYIRTSSQTYDLQEPENQLIHLTNDAIQIKGQNYGRFEDANKLSYTEFQRYLDYSFTGKGYSLQNIIKQMKSIMVDVIKATYLNLDKDRKKDNFQLFGFDFMIDRDFRLYLIQVNSNPCLVVNCNILARIVPPLIQNTLRLGLDPLLPPKIHLPANKRHNLSQNYLKNLRYQLIFDEQSLQKDIYNKPQLQDSEDQQQYCDNGKQLPDNFTF